MKTSMDKPDEATPNPKPTTVEDLLVAWYGELETMVFAHKANYAQEGLQTVFNDVAITRERLTRLDWILSKGRRLEHRLRVQIESVQGTYDDKLDVLRRQPEKLIGRGFGAQEREAWCRSSPELIQERINLRRLTASLGEVQTFVKVGEARYRNLDGARNDLLLMTSLIRLGLNIREVT